MIPQTLFSPLQEPKHREVYIPGKELGSSPATKPILVTLNCEVSAAIRPPLLHNYAILKISNYSKT
jgi:hypothetical protein